MPKRPSYEIQRKILLAVREGTLKYSELERRLRTGYRSIKSNCEQLKDHEYVEVDTIAKDPANGKPSYPVKITPKGKDFLKRIEKK
jgi:predicted transcriptional regulator